MDKSDEFKQGFAAGVIFLAERLSREPEGWLGETPEVTGKVLKLFGDEIRALAIKGGIDVPVL